MTHFITQSESKDSFELLIDTKIFPKDVILNAAYNFLDIGYFFFKYDEKNNIILECKAKEGADFSTEKLLGEYSDELLAVYLRDRIEHENKAIREAIVVKAINGPLDMQNFVTLDTDALNNDNKSVDIDADIDEILKDIENEPELQIDEQEIENILKEIQQEHQIEIEKPTIHFDPNVLPSLKDMFKK